MIKEESRATADLSAPIALCAVRRRMLEGHLAEDLAAVLEVERQDLHRIARELISRGWSKP